MFVESDELKIVRLDYTKLVNNEDIVNILDYYLKKIGLLDFVNKYDIIKNHYYSATTRMDIIEKEKLKDDDRYGAKCKLLAYLYPSLAYYLFYTLRNNDVIPLHIISKVYDNNNEILKRTIYHGCNNQLFQYFVHNNSSNDNGIYICSDDILCLYNFHCTMFYYKHEREGCTSPTQYILIPFHYKGFFLYLVKLYFSKILYSYLKFYYPITNKIYFNLVAINTTSRAHKLYFPKGINYTSTNIDDFTEEVKYYFIPKDEYKEPLIVDDNNLIEYCKSEFGHDDIYLSPTN